MQKFNSHLFFEAHDPVEIPENLQEVKELEDYLSDVYSVQNRVRTKYFTEVLADILCITPEGAKILLSSSRSEELKLIALFSRLASQKPSFLNRDRLCISPAGVSWHSFTGHKRWHLLIRTAYVEDEENRCVFNENASISNFPGGRSDIPEKIDNDHRLNYFLWSLWEGFTPEKKAQLPHLRYERRDGDPNGSALSCQFVEVLLRAGYLLESCVVEVEALDERHWSGKVLPHAIKQDHVDIVLYHLDQMLFTARHGHLPGESLRADLIKSAALNMAFNEVDGIEEAEKTARPHIPCKLSAVLNLSGTKPYTTKDAKEMLGALAQDFDIAPSAIPDDLLELTHCLADAYVRNRQPYESEAIKHFTGPHASIRSHGFHAALLLHDHLHKVRVPRQVKGDTAAYVSAYAGIKKVFTAKHVLTESHWKFYLNRYAALFYGHTDGHTLEEGVDSYYETRKLKRSVMLRFLRECWGMDSVTIAHVVPQLAPEQLLFSSPFTMPKAKVAYRPSLH